MNAVKNKLYSFARWVLGLLGMTARPTAPDPQRPSPLPAKTLVDRRAFIAGVTATAGMSSALGAVFETILPVTDDWRYGWIPGPRKSKVYYGIDWGTAESVAIWIYNDGVLQTRLDSVEHLEHYVGFAEAAAEIKISQGHRGMALTGGARHLPGDTWRDETDESGLSGDHEFPNEEVVMLSGTSDEAIDLAAARAARTGPTRDQRTMTRAAKLGFHSKLVSGGIKIDGQERMSIDEANEWMSRLEGSLDES